MEHKKKTTKILGLYTGEILHGERMYYWIRSWRMKHGQATYTFLDSLCKLMDRQVTRHNLKLATLLFTTRDRKE